MLLMEVGVAPSRRGSKFRRIDYETFLELAQAAVEAASTVEGWDDDHLSVAKWEPKATPSRMFLAEFRRTLRLNRIRVDPRRAVEH